MGCPTDRYQPRWGDSRDGSARWLSGAGSPSGRRSGSPLPRQRKPSPKAKSIPARVPATPDARAHTSQSGLWEAPGSLLGVKWIADSDLQQGLQIGEESRSGGVELKADALGSLPPP